MGRTACTEPQCLYKGARYLKVELYLNSPYGPTACTEPQCLYKGALYLTVELYLYSHYGPYGLYRASVPVQGCTLPVPFYIWSPWRNLKLEYSDDKVIMKDEYLEGSCHEIFEGNTEIFPKIRKLRKIYVMRGSIMTFQFIASLYNFKTLLKRYIF